MDKPNAKESLQCSLCGRSADKYVRPYKYLDLLFCPSCWGKCTDKLAKNFEDLVLSGDGSDQNLQDGKEAADRWNRRHGKNGKK